MPELPEVETTRRALEPALVGRTILSIDHDNPERYRNTLDAVGRRIETVGRRGKYLLLGLEGDREAVVHLKMTGGFRFPEGGRFLEPPRFERLRLVTDGGEVSFTDMRRFANWWVVPRGEYAGIETLRGMGPEPLSEDFRPEPFAAAMARTPKVKLALLSQRPVAGLGNIYADEALWLSGLHPEAGHLSPEESARLHAAIRDVLGRAVAARGSTLGDNTYRQPDGNPGAYQLEHRAYGRAGEPCERCGTPIEKYRLGGRGTHRCPSCQRL